MIALTHYTIHYIYLGGGLLFSVLSCQVLDKKCLDTQTDLPNILFADIINQNLRCPLYFTVLNSHMPLYNVA